MSSIRYTALKNPEVSLTSRNWTTDARGHSALVGWWTMREGRFTLTGASGSERVTAVAPRVGQPSLTLPAQSLGPKPTTKEGMSGAAFTNTEQNALICATPAARDSFALVLIAWNEDTIPAQNRILASIYGNGENMKLWRMAVTAQYSWRNGLTDAATTVGGWRTAGPLMLIAERSGDTVRIRGRDRTRTGDPNTGTITISLPTTVTMVLGQDEIADGHAGAIPNVSQSWGGGFMEAALYSGSVLDNPALLSFWDAYFTAVYQTPAV